VSDLVNNFLCVSTNRRRL